MGELTDYVESNGRFGIGDEGPHVKLAQEALAMEGAELVLDGDFGPMTEAATKVFQSKHDLEPVGYVGPKTAAALDEVLEGGGSIIKPPASKIPPWLAAMRSITGTKEIPGSKNSPIIMAWSGEIARAYPDYAKYSRTYTADSIPWCGLCVAYCTTVGKFKPVAEYLWAANWSKWGVALKEPKVGAILTFKREGGNHVALFDGFDGAYMLVRGGNQSDMVSVARRQRGTQTATRWPTGYPLPK